MAKTQGILLKQPIMFKVLYALVPILLASVYYYGWRTIAVLAVVNVVGFLSEYIFARQNKAKVSSAVFVTNFLYALSLPPTIPYWIAAVGIAFGVIFGKMVFGGFGRNVFNPAISGRAFVYASFGYQLSSRFVPPVGGTLGGFIAWSPGLDAVTQATPLVRMSAGESVPFLDLLLGSTAGSMGETAAFLIILSGLYLIFTKTASWHIIVSVFVGFFGMQSILHYAGVSAAIAPQYALFAGSILYGMMYMATDPVSSSQTTNLGRVIYGAFIGVLTVLIRTFSIWPEGITFAILLANMFAPLLNYLIVEQKKKKKVKAAGGTA